MRPKRKHNESGKKSGWDDLAMGRKMRHVKDPRRIEQVGDIHVLEAKVLGGNASEREVLLLTVQQYELKHFEYKELQAKEAKDRISLVQKEDMVWLSGKLAEDMKGYTKALERLRELGEDI